jgi:hypothetical protein
VVAIAMVVVPSVGHIEASMVRMPVSLTDPNSDAADPDIGAFGDDYGFVAAARRTGKRRHRQERNKKKGKTAFFMAFSSGGTFAVPMLGRIRAWYSSSLYRIDQCCSRAAAEINGFLEYRWHPLCRSGQRLLRSTQILDLRQRHSTMRRDFYAALATPDGRGTRLILHLTLSGNKTSTTTLPWTPNK